MSELGDLLELMHGARGRIATVRATVRIWNHVARLHEAMERRGTLVAFGTPVEDAERESVLRVWLAPPDLAREEHDEGQPELAGGGTGPAAWWLLDPAPIIGLLDYDRFARGQCAGRETISVRAQPRATGDGDDWPLIRLHGEGADELLLEVDAERGAVLRIEARLAGRPYAIYEVLEVAFDEPLADDLFVPTAPPDQELQPITGSKVRWDLTIEQAVALAPFTVWVPRQVAAWEIDIAFIDESERPPIAATILLVHRTSDGSRSIDFTQTAAEDEEHEPPGASSWRTLERSGRVVEVRDPSESWEPAELRVELDGTRVLMHSSHLDTTALADVAAALVPARPDGEPAIRHGPR